jgi:hypothetical protein
MANRAAWLIALLICVGTTSTQAGLTKWPGNGHCYEFRLRSDGIDWQTAENESVADAGTLATVTSEAENSFVFSLLTTPGITGAWLGGFQPAGAPEPAGQWTWVTGEPFTFNRWEVGEPNDGFGHFEEDAISFFTFVEEGPRVTWNDIPRSIALTAYVFETELCDEDGDGFRPPQDCDETDPSINPNATELPGNFVDENCDGNLGTCDPCHTWRNHGEYVRCVSGEVEALVDTFIITQEEGDALVTSAARSDVGKKGFVPTECQP